jgi:hypothetical protein
LEKENARSCHQGYNGGESYIYHHPLTPILNLANRCRRITTYYNTMNRFSRATSRTPCPETTAGVYSILFPNSNVQSANNPSREKYSEHCHRNRQRFAEAGNPRIVISDDYIPTTAPFLDGILCLEHNCRAPDGVQEGFVNRNVAAGNWQLRSILNISGATVRIMMKKQSGNLLGSLRQYHSHCNFSVFNTLCRSRSFHKRHL